MADVIEKVLKITDQGSDAVRALAGNLKGLEQAEKDAARAAKELEQAQREVAQASRRLEELAVAGDKVQTAALNLRRLREEVRELVALNPGNAGLAQRIIGDAEAEFAAMVAQSNRVAPALNTVADSAERVAETTGMGRMQMLSLRYAAADAANSLIAGASPFMVLMQQGAQAIEAIFLMDGGFKAFAASIKASVLPALASAATVLGTIAAAAVIAAEVWVIYTNTVNDATAEQVRADQAASDLADSASRGADEVDRLKRAWDGFMSISTDVTTQLDLINGKTDEFAVAAEKQIAAAREQAEVQIRADAERVAQLQVAIAANERVYATEEAGAEARAEASAAIVRQREELAAATATLQGHRTALAETEQGILNVAEYKREEAAAAEALREREEALRAAREASNRTAREQAEIERFLAEVRGIVIAALGEEERAAAEHQARVAQLNAESIRLTGSTEAAADAVATLTAEYEKDKAARERAENIRETAEIMEQVYAPAVDRGAEALARFYAAIDRVDPPAMLSTTEQLALAEADLALALSQGAISADAYAAAMERLGQARGNTGAGGASAGDVAQIAGSAISDPLGAIATAGGPIAAGIIAGVQGLSNLSGTLDGLRGLLQGLGSELSTGGAALGQFVADAVGTIVPAAVMAVDDFVLGLVRSVPEIVAGLARGAPSIAIALVETMTPLFGVKVALALVEGMIEADWSRIGQRIVRGIGEAWDDFAGSLASSIGGVFGEGAQQFVAGILDPANWLQAAETFGEGFLAWLRTAISDVGAFFGAEPAAASMGRSRRDPGLFERGGAVDRLFTGRSFDTGSTYIDRTGLAMLHKGEEVINPTGMGSERQGMAVARASRVRFGGGPSGLRGVVEFDIDFGSYAAAVGEGRRRGFGV